MARQLVLRIRRLDLLYFDEAFVSDMMLADAPSGVIVNALRWEILNDWVQYLNGDTSKDKTAEMSYRWGFVKRDTGFDSLKCLWGKHEHNYPMFAEAVWLSAAEGSGNGAEARGGSGRAAAGCRVTVPAPGPRNVITAMPGARGVSDSGSNLPGRRGGDPVGGFGVGHEQGLCGVGGGTLHGVRV